ncbi:uncharacterized protein LOC105167294 [Sesamum indicum]|uniref:Uncharacterized protein LOC105167294 n=1 Tax=Sesamum indicum TaxID=4182 RepID=A0A6I9TLL6_SESIN|nr:uncharacterized protein LOC105167294 [Sesamum indicum]
MAAAAAAAKLMAIHSKEADIHQGDICKVKALQVLEEFSVPKGLLPVEEIQEMGFNRSTGFLWFKMKKKVEHKFKSIGQTVIYNVEITCFLEKGHLSKLTGVKAKELMLPVGITDILVGEPSPDTIKFTTAIGVSRSYPASAFASQD